MALTIGIEGLGVIANADALTNDTGGNATGDWGEDGGGTISLNPDAPLYGTYSIGSKYATKSGYTYFNRGAGLDFTATTGAYEGQFIYFWIMIQSKSAFDTLANKGFAIRIGSSLSDYREYKIAGTADANGWNGKWKCFVIDPTKTGSVTDTGTFDISSVQYFGVWIDTVVSVRADSIFLSQIAVGSGLRITGTSTTGWKDVVEYCTDLASRAWGMFEEREGTYFCKGKIYIGDSTQSAETSFKDSGRAIQFERSEYYDSSNAWASTLPTTAFGIIVEDNATYKTTFEDGIIVGTDNGRSGSSIKGNVNEEIILDLYGGNHADSVTALYNTKFSAIYGAINFGNDTGHKMLGVSFTDCSQVDPVGAIVIRNCTFAETKDVDAALLWNENIDIQSCSFISNTLGAAIEHPSAAGTPYTYTDLLFSGNTNDGLNSSGTNIVVNKSGTSNPVNDEGANTITYSASVPLTITVQDEDKTVLENVQVSMYLLASPYTELMNEDTLSTGIASDSYSGTTPVDVVIKARKSETTDDPRYFAYSDTAKVIASTGLSRTITLKVNPFLAAG